jgi:hypothetical protein
MPVTLQEEKWTNQANMEAKLGADMLAIWDEMDDNQEKMDEGQVKWKAQMGSHTCDNINTRITCLITWCSTFKNIKAAAIHGKCLSYLVSFL